MALEKQPKLSNLIMAVIVSWSGLESNLGLMFAILLHGSLEVSHDIYYAFRDRELRNTVFNAVASKKLSASLTGKLETFFREVKTAAGDRNDVAHKLWLFEPAYPECICSLDAKLVSLETVQLFAEVKIGKQLIADGAALSRRMIGKPVTKYYDRDFQTMLARIEQIAAKGLDLAMEMNEELDATEKDLSSPKQRH